MEMARNQTSVTHIPVASQP